mmetsp:Transcript_17940/g.30181  ORF Transcript_17940/g.30181 Transcript_17940/m.30181 type:complete len:330 (-) Transcript_17940:2308-3297(-)
MSLRKFVLVVIELSACLDLLEDSLDGRLLIALGQRLLGRLHFRHVSKRVGHGGDDGGIANLVVLAVHPSHLAARGQVTSIHDPLLGAQLRDELVVVADDDHASLEVLNRACKSAQRLAVEVVGRLVEHQDVRLVPHGGCHHHLHLLSARQSRHAVVRAELWSETAVVQVRLHIGRGERADGQTRALGESCVDRQTRLLPTTASELLGPHRTFRAISELTLVLVLLRARLTTRSSEFNHDLVLLVRLAVVVHPGHLEGLLLQLFLLGSQDHAHLHEGLLVFPVTVTPTNVLVRRLVQVALDVVECVLGDVGDTSVGMLPHLARLRHNFPS